MKKPFNWKIFFILLIAALLGAIAVIPYSLAINPSSPGAQTLTWQALALGLTQNTILFSLLIGIGLLLANSIGLGLPILEAALRKESTGKAIREMLPISIILGAAGGSLIILLDRLIFQPAIFAEVGEKAKALFSMGAEAGPWKSFLASFYGGIDEEIMLRLFFMSLLVWLGRFISKTSDGKPTLVVLWTAAVLAAVVFGLAHLPATASFVPLTPWVVARGILLNSLVGIPCGYLYFKRGLESAMVAHFSADIVLHVIFGI